MEGGKGALARVTHFVHERMLWFLLGAYVLAGVFPGPGVWVRSVGAWAEWLGEASAVTLPMLMLAALLLNAGLGIEARRLWGLLRRPRSLAAGLAANLLAPLLFILAVSQGMRLWHNPDEVQNILVGLALVASMPVAGSSTAWTQNSGGDMALSLGLVVFSTCLSPVTTPAALHAVGWMASGAYAEGLHQLADGGAGAFLGLFVLLPSLLGMALRALLGGPLVALLAPGIRTVNVCTLLVLCYSNASVALPQTVADPDWDFLAVMLAVVVALCALNFSCGWGLGRALEADAGRRAALMFGLGMNNNGTGLVIAATALSRMPDVMLPVIFYNLVQHVAAVLVAPLARPESRRPPPPAAAGAPARLRKAS
jgi:BASS family bile acid:Na+ symporter